MTTPETTSSLGQRLLGAARWFERKTTARTPKVERLLLAVALVLFVLSAIAGLLALPSAMGPISWGLLALVAFLGAPAAMLFVALEYQLGAQVLRLRVSLWESIRISILSSAANLLPLPGSVLIRTRGLKQAGSSYRQALAVLAMLGLVWVGTASVFAGSLLWSRNPVFGALAVTVGAAILGGGLSLMPMLSPPSGRLPLALRIVLIELGGILLGTIRLYLIVRAMSLPISVAQAAALQLAGVVAIATGIFPGGLGIREILSAAISPLVGLPASVGVVAAALGRLLLKPILIPIGAFMLVRSRRGREGSPGATAGTSAAPPEVGDLSTPGRAEL